MAATVVCREEVEEIPMDICYTDGSSQGNASTWTEVAIQPNKTPSGWKWEQITTASGLSSVVWLVITLEPWP